MNSYSTKIFIRKNGDNNDNEKIVELNTKLPGEEYTIGWVDGCDIQLSNDTGYMSKCHCVLKKEVFGWTVRDTSTNGTKLLQESRIIEVQRSTELLHNQNVLLIEDWHLTFRDPAKTDVKPHSISSIKCPWVFSVSEEVLYKVENGNRIRVKVSPQIKIMLHYMASQNIAHNNVPIVCRYKELTQLMWGDIPGPLGRERLCVIAQKIRKILDPSDNKNKGEKWFETNTSEGYILNINCET